MLKSEEYVLCRTYYLELLSGKQGFLKSCLVNNILWSFRRPPEEEYKLCSIRMSTRAVDVDL